MPQCNKDCRAFHNWRRNAIHLNFPNGNSISTTWARGSYSENHNEWDDARDFGDKDLPSNNCEIMFNCGDKLKKRIEKKFNEGDAQPIGYLEMTQWLEIVNLLAKEKTTPTSSLQPE